MQEEAEKSILIAAKLISPVIEDNYTSGTGTSRLLTRSFCRKEDNVIILF